MIVADLGANAPALAVATAAALATWAVVVAVVTIATRPRHIDAGPEVLELPGAEPPAVVNLLAHGWRVEHAAVPATLLDLAARGAATFERTDIDEFSVRLTGTTPANLAPYEAMVLDHVRSIASNGVVPCAALATGPEEQSARWWSRFAAAVARDARDRGLSRPRFSHALVVVLDGLAGVPALCSVVAVFALVQRYGDQGAGFPLALLGEPFFVWALLVGFVNALQRPVDTDLGRATAAKWLGLRDKLRGDDVFADLPPSAITLWDRFLGYGAALGVAAGAVRGLPLGSESDTEAWSPVGGRWRVVRVHYPSRRLFGWGDHPLTVAWRGVWNMALPVFAVLVVWPAVQDNRADLVKIGTDHRIAWVDRAIAIAAVAGAIVLALVALRALVMFVFGVIDLFSHVSHTGRAIRIRNRGPKDAYRYIAVDDGTQHDIRAWRVVRPFATGQGDTVDAVVTRRLGFVRSMVARVDMSAPAPSPLEAASIRPARLLEAAQVSAAVGEPVTDVSDSIGAASTTNTILAGIKGEVSAFQARDGMVIVGRAPSQGRELYRSSIDRLPAMLHKPVAGVGDEASIILGRTLVALRGDEVVSVSVSLHHLDRDASATAATALARAMLA